MSLRFYLGLGGIRYRLANLESWATIGSSEEHRIYLREKEASFITNVEREGIRI